MKIKAVEVDNGLTKVLGCNNEATFSPLTLPEEPGSLWGLYLKRVVPETLFVNQSRKSGAAGRGWFVSSTGSLRYPLFSGPVVVL